MYNWVHFFLQNELWENTFTNNLSEMERQICAKNTVWEKPIDAFPLFLGTLVASDWISYLHFLWAYSSWSKLVPLCCLCVFYYTNFFLAKPKDLPLLVLIKPDNSNITKLCSNNFVRQAHGLSASDAA